MYMYCCTARYCVVYNSLSRHRSRMSEPQAEGSAKEQRLFIIRHGERRDNVDYRWLDTAVRPYDPPLTAQGTLEASSAARERFVGKEIKYVVSSPFLRCLQTAHQISTVLQLSGIHTCNRIVDVLNGHSCGIYEKPEVPAMTDVEKEGISVVKFDDTPLPAYPERTRDGLKRFNPEYKKLADHHWPHNMVIVTHGYGVMQALTLAEVGRRYRSVYVDYCGHVELSRSGKGTDAWALEQHQGLYLD